MWKAPQAIAARPSSTSWAPAVDGAGDLGAVLQGPVGDAGDVGLVVLADVGGVGARDGALVAHPGDRDGGVEAAGERDADALADGQGGEDLAHGVGSFWFGVGVWRGPGTGGRGRRRRRVAADHQHGVVAGDGAEDVGELGSCRTPRPGTGRRPGGVRSTTRLALASALTSSSPSSRASRCGGGGALPGRRRSSVAALAGYGVDEGAGGAADLDRVELDQVARQRGLGDVEAGLGEQVGELGLRAHLGRVETSSMIGWWRAFLVCGRMAVSFIDSSSSQQDR